MSTSQAGERSVLIKVQHIDYLNPLRYIFLPRYQSHFDIGRRFLCFAHRRMNITVKFDRRTGCPHAQRVSQGLLALLYDGGEQQPRIRRVFPASPSHAAVGRAGPDSTALAFIAFCLQS